MTGFLVVAGLLALLGLWVVLTNNSFVRARNKVDEAWSGIDVQLKRRHDLVPNLVETVQGYAEHESATLASVTQARSAAMTAESRAERGTAETLLTGALDGVRVVAEQYPELRASEGYRALQGELRRARGPDPGRAPHLQRERQRLQHAHPAVPELARRGQVVHGARPLPARLAGRAGRSGRHLLTVVGPAHANAGRGQHCRATLGRPAVVSALVLAPSAALVAGAAYGGAAAALAAPLAAIALIVAWAWRTGERQAERAFWNAVAEATGFAPVFDVALMQHTTPLLHAGDRRRFHHVLAGPLGGVGIEVRLAQYGYEVDHEDSKGNGVTARYRFTICLTELPGGMELFPGVYLRARRGVAGRLGHDWLKGRRVERVELESADFNAAYELFVTPEQDHGRLRELFDPKTIVWLAEHPLRPSFELRAGFLVVYVAGHLEDLGRLVWLLEAAERLAGRLRDEIAEAAGAPPAAGASPAAGAPPAAR